MATFSGHVYIVSCWKCVSTNTKISFKKKIVSVCLFVTNVGVAIIVKVVAACGAALKAVRKMLLWVPAIAPRVQAYLACWTRTITLA